MALAAVCFGPGVVGAGEPYFGTAEAEMSRRAAAAGEAHELLVKGDESYHAGRWEEAAGDYRRAMDLLPDNAPAVAQLRAEAVERYAVASIELAREQRRLGDIKGALETVDQVLEEGVAPGHAGALATREQILDPIRTEPASSKEHTANIEEVRLLLYRAESAYNLGKFDEASMVCEEVLRVDPTNQAARRLMERVAAAKSDYGRAAYDQARAEMLAAVDQGWELPVVPTDELLHSNVGMGVQTESFGYADKLEQIVVPVVALDDVSLQESIDYLRQQSMSLDTSEPDPALRGVNFVVELGSPDSEIGRQLRQKRFSINLRNVPLATVLQYIAEATDTAVKVQPFAVKLVPVGSVSSEIIVRTYRVPPDFLSAGSSGAGGGAVNDPFSEQPEKQLLPRRLAAEEVLKDRGVSFPEGASAAFNSGNSTLRVSNTAENHALIEQIVDAMASEEPVAIIVEVKVLKTQQRRLKELGFDWLLGDFSLGGLGTGEPSAFLSGGTRGNGGDLSDLPNFASPNPPNPITAGNRSGDSAISGNSIDGLILQANQGFASNSARAPGIFSLNGLLNEAQFSVMMRGLDQKTGVDLAAVPSVVTRSGQAASIRITRELIYPTEYEPPELPNSVGGGGFLLDLDTGEALGESLNSFPVTPATPTSFDMREVGIVLDVLPTVDQSRQYVDLTLSPKITEFDGFINYGSPIISGGGQSIVNVGGMAQVVQTDGVVVTPNRILMPVFSQLSTETALTVADNATMVYAGLLQEKVENVEDQTPILGDIPILGRLFQSKASSPVQTAVVFFVHVRVVDGGGRPFNP